MTDSTAIVYAVTLIPPLLIGGWASAWGRGGRYGIGYFLATLALFVGVLVGLATVLPILVAGFIGYIGSPLIMGVMLLIKGKSIERRAQEAIKMEGLLQTAHESIARDKTNAELAKKAALRRMVVKDARKLDGG